MFDRPGVTLRCGVETGGEIGQRLFGMRVERQESDVAARGA